MDFGPVRIRCYGDPSHGAIAQLVERFHGMEEVRGSIPLSSTPRSPGLGSGLCCVPAPDPLAGTPPRGPTTTASGARQGSAVPGSGPAARGSPGAGG